MKANREQRRKADKLGIPIGLLFMMESTGALLKNQRRVGEEKLSKFIKNAATRLNVKQ